jgi:hypothetical protein
VEKDLIHFLLISKSMNMVPMGQATIIGDFVGQRQ